MEATPHTPAVERVVFAASSIATHVARGQTPPEKELFVFSAAVVQSATDDDGAALEVGIDSAAALLEQLPDGVVWDECRGHLKAVMEFAWLLQPIPGAVEAGACERAKSPTALGPDQDRGEPRP